MKKHHLRYLLCSVCLSALSGQAVAATAASYTQLYQDSIINTLEVGGNLAKAQSYTDCHLMALGAFPKTIQQAVFKISEETNDYVVARKKFSELVALEMAADDRRKQEINKVMVESRTIGEACLADVGLE